MPTTLKSPETTPKKRGIVRRSVTERLGAINWDFPDAKYGETIHSIHPYPARFIADIPRALIRELRPPTGTAILDPFCGCGTTLVEAQVAGLPSVGIDLNPIACLIARVKTNPIPPELAPAAAALVRSAKTLAAPTVPTIPNLDHWFQKHVQTAVAALTSQIDAMSPGNLVDHMRLALSSILVRVSNQDSDTRYAAVSKNITSDQVFSQFLAACRRLDAIKPHLQFAYPPARIIESSVLEVTPAQISLPVGLVITSPPYPNAYEYWLYHKYRMWWLGYDPLAVKNKEIGARAHYFKKNHATVEDFRNQMRSVLTLISSVVVPGGFICIVIGRSRIHGTHIDNGSLIAEIAAEAGLHSIARLTRTIAPARKSFNLAHARIASEDLLVFQQCT